jgi:large subunit ribosomal protein L24
MHVKKGDMVKVLTGVSRGKTGKILRAFPDKDKVIVEGVNMRKHHEKPRRADQKGQTVEKAMPVHVSNVAKVLNK